MLRTISLLLFIASLVLLASCDKMATLNYKVKNLSSDSIRIISVRKDGAVLKSDTVKLSYNQQLTIAAADQGFEHISNYKISAPTLTDDFQSIAIYKVHSGQASVTNFMQTSLWTYNETSKSMADYTTTVSDNDF